MIEGIEQLEAQLQRIICSDGPVFHERRVDVEARRTVHEVAVTVAEGAVVAGDEGSWIEVLLKPVRTASLSDLERNSWDAVSAVAAAKLQTAATVAGFAIGGLATT